nr:response regulator transcription factor [Eubacterium sp.]
DKILGLEYGADDYITKPFNILEVKARIKAIIRRSNKSGSKSEAKAAPASTQEDLIRLDKDGRRAFIEGREVSLTAKEFELLEFLMNNPNKIYNRDKLLHEVWGLDYPGDVRTVDVHIRRMREKIELNPSEPKFIHTKWGVGYYFDVKR